MIPFGTTAPSAATQAATMILIVANIAVFFVQLGLPGNEATRFLYTYALVPAVYGHPIWRARRDWTPTITGRC